MVEGSRGKEEECGGRMGRDMERQVKGRAEKMEAVKEKDSGEERRREKEKERVRERVKDTWDFVSTAECRGISAERRCAQSCPGVRGT